MAAQGDIYCQETFVPDWLYEMRASDPTLAINALHSCYNVGCSNNLCSEGVPLYDDCCYTNEECDDGDPCTVDRCTDDAGHYACTHDTPLCDDADPRSADFCCLGDDVSSDACRSRPDPNEPCAYEWDAMACEEDADCAGFDGNDGCFRHLCNAEGLCEEIDIREDPDLADPRTSLLRTHRSV